MKCKLSKVLFNQKRAFFAFFLSSYFTKIFFFSLVFLFFLVNPSEVFAQEGDDNYPPPQITQSPKSKKQIRALKRAIYRMYKRYYRMRLRYRRRFKKLRRRITSLEKKVLQLQIRQKRLRRLERKVKILSFLVKKLLKRRSQRPSQRRPQHAPPLLKQTPPSIQQSPPSQRPSKLPRFAPPTRRQIPVKIKIQAYEYAKGVFQLVFIPNRQLGELWYKLPNMKAFRSTGFLNTIHPMTGKKMPRLYLMTRHLKRGWNIIYLQYSDLKGRIYGPRRFRFFIKSKILKDAENFVQYQWVNPVVRQLRVRTYRHMTIFLPLWASNKSIFRTIRYSFNDKKLNYYLAYRGKFLSNLLTLKNLQEGRYILYMRATLKNGWKTPLLRYDIDVLNDGRWYIYYPKEKR